jgi:putative protease
LFAADGETVEVRSEATLAPASKRALDRTQLREQLGRLGDSPFALAALDDAALEAGLFLPVSELNRLRQRAVEELLVRRDWARQAQLAERAAAVEEAVATIAPRGRGPAIEAMAARLPVVAEPSAVATSPAPFDLRASVWTLDDARAAAAAGATEVVLDPFLRHPTPPVSRVRALAAELAAQGVGLRLRTPTIVRSGERRTVDKWIALGLPVLSGHLGLVGELAASGRDVVADYALNVFNQHAAAEFFSLGARRLTLSIELTVEEMLAVAAPWHGTGFDAFVYGRPEGMTIEHCVLSAAFERVATTCRDLCVQKHVNVELTDPAGYTFPVATDSACRNRLLHSRPVEGSEYLPRLWAGGLRGYQLVFNVPGDPVASVVRAYRELLDGLAADQRVQTSRVRQLVGQEFTRGHFARAV